MILKIKQKKFSFFVDTYTIYEDDAVIGTAKSALFSLHKRVHCYNNDGQEQFNIKKFIASIHQKYGVNFSDGSYLEIKGKSWIYEYYQVQVPEGLLEIHHQKGIKLAVFLNEEQVAEIKKKRLVLLEGDEYVLMANSDFDRQLLIAICLAWDIGDSKDSDDSFFSFDFGKIGPVKRKSLPDWMPTR